MNTNMCAVLNGAALYVAQLELTDNESYALEVQKIVHKFFLGPRCGMFMGVNLSRIKRLRGLV